MSTVAQCDTNLSEQRLVDELRNANRMLVNAHSNVDAEMLIKAQGQQYKARAQYRRLSLA
jgi:hypothetical protein